MNKKVLLGVLLFAPIAVLFCATTVLASAVITDIRINGASGSTTMTVGQSQQLTAVDQNNEDVTSSISWSSSDTGILTVSRDGLVRAVGAGSATITGASTWITRNIIFTVNAGATTNTTTVITSIRITGSSGSTTMTVGQTQQLTAIDQNNENVTSIVSWSSSDTGVLTVNGSGFVAAAGVGRAQITASSALITRNIIFNVNAASSSSGSVTSTGTGTGTGDSLLANGEDCTVDGECSSGNCNNNGKCAAAKNNGSGSTGTGGTKNNKSVNLTNPLGNIKTFQQLLARIAAGVGQLITALGAVMIVVSGILYLLSAGSPEKLATARKAFMYAIMGIVIGLAATAIVSVIEQIIGVSS